MNNKDKQSNLQVQLCELKLEERRLRMDISQFVSQSKMLDFARAKELNRLQTGLKSKIKAVEAQIIPNIIA